jgi:AcrR family transcriptional regulator
MDPVAVRRPGRPRSAAIHAAILDAAVDELTERGFSGLSMEAVAGRAGVAKTTLYRRWPSTEQLALEAIRSLGGGYTAVPPPGSPREELLCLLDGMRRTWTNPRYAALMRRVAADATARPTMYRDFRTRLIGPALDRMHATLQRAVDEGQIRRGTDLVWVRQLICSPILAAALTHKDRVSRAQLEFTLDTVLAGLRPQAQP